MLNNKEFKQTLLAGVLVVLVSSVVCLQISPLCALVCFLATSLLVGIFCIYTKKRYSALEHLNQELSLVCAGVYDLHLEDNTEGELSILKNNLYKVITLLRTQNDLLSKDKVLLADNLADISHQLKTPITSMMMMTDLLQDETDEAKRKEFISILNTQLEKMRWLILNLLKLSKLDAGTLELKKEEVSLQEVIKDSLRPFLVMMDVKKIQLQNTAEDLTFRGDAGWTAEALGNIIKNCLEHTAEGGTLDIYTERTNIYVAVHIRDNGCGIAKEDLPHIFERFYRGKNSSPESVGIGLALAKTIVEKEKGRILVKSELGKGTDFEIRFYKAIV